MKKADVRFAVDGLLFISIIGVVLIGFLLGFVLPKGPAASEEAKYLLGLHRHDWGDIHLYLGIAFTVLAALHLVLGWGWVKSKARKLFQWRWTAAVISMPVLALFVVSLLWLVSLKDGDKYAEYGEGARRDRATGEVATGDGGVPVTGQRGSSRSENRDSYRARDLVLTVDKAHEHAANQTDVVITGQMSLRDIERLTGLPARHVARELGLPANASLDERLGRLRRSHAFSMQDVRDVVASLTR
jgi:hypothetical protein